jgi:hypothetical protein
VREKQNNPGACIQKIQRGKEQEENEYPKKLYETTRPGKGYGQTRKMFGREKQDGK